jgi:hypothetical protein
MLPLKEVVIWAKAIRTCGAGLFVAALAACITHYCDNISRPYWQSVFENNKKDLARFVSGIRSGEYKSSDDGAFPISPPLSKNRIAVIDKKDGFVFFGLRPEGPDDPIEAIVFDLDDKASGASVRVLFSLLSDRIIYQIQHIEGGWYYCMYN